MNFGVIKMFTSATRQPLPELVTGVF